MFRITCLVALLVCAHGALAAELRIHLADAEGSAVADAVVYLEATGGSASTQPSSAVNLIDQVNKEFVPRVIAVQAGSLVNFPNRDNIRHHVYSFSEAKQFELPLYEGTPAEPVRFERSGLVTLGCNIHDWMRGHVLVVDSSIFGRTDNDGTISLKQIPADQYRVMIWHPDIKGGEPLLVDTLDIAGIDQKQMAYSLELRKQLRIRRAPRSRRERY